MLKQLVFSTALMLSGAAVAQTPTPGGTTAPAASSPSPSPVATPPGVVAPQSPIVSPAGKVAPTAPANLSAADQKFLEKVASANTAEIQASQLAEQKGTDPHVKDVAQQMLTDHTEAGQKLTALAQQEGVTIPAELAAADQKQLDKFSKLDGKKFDRTFVKSEISDHQKMLAVLKKEASTGKDSEVKAFAASLVPTIQKHLDMLQNKTTG